MFVFQQENASGQIGDISVDDETITLNPNSCSMAWSQYENGYYWILQDVYNWTWARSQCQKLGAELVSIHSKGQDDFIAMLTGWTGRGEVWLGGLYSAEQEK